LSHRVSPSYGKERKWALIPGRVRVISINVGKSTVYGYNNLFETLVFLNFSL
jgi:hypothetical protein